MYWAKRRINNAAAKCSREARRVKDFQTLLRTLLLKRQNDYLIEEVIKHKNTIKTLVFALKILMESTSKFQTTLPIIQIILNKLSNEYKSVT